MLICTWSCEYMCVCVHVRTCTILQELYSIIIFYNLYVCERASQGNQNYRLSSFLSVQKLYEYNMNTQICRLTAKYFFILYDILKGLFLFENQGSGTKVPNF